MNPRDVLTGAALATAARALLPRLLRAKFDRDVARLNAGDHAPLLTAYADDAVLHFADGEHRWAGDWVGRADVGRFLENFTAARVQGTIRQIAVTGPLGAVGRVSKRTIIAR